jgi:hypothetical protein
VWTVPEVPWWGVVSSAAAPVLLIGGWTVAAALQRAGFDPVTGTISALAALDADDRWVMTAALAGLGCCHVGTAAALRPAALPGRVLLAAGGVGTVLVAAFPLPVGDGKSAAHTAAAGLAFGALGAWPALAWRRAASWPHRPSDAAGSRVTAYAPSLAAGSVTRGRAPSLAGRATVPPAFRPWVAGAAAGVLLGAVGWFVVELATGGRAVGLAERVAAGAQAVWPLLAVLSARSHRA